MSHTHTILLKEINIRQGSNFGTISVEIILNDGNRCEFALPKDVELIITEILMHHNLEIGECNSGFTIYLRNKNGNKTIAKIIDKSIVDDLDNKIKQWLKKENNLIKAY